MHHAGIPSTKTAIRKPWRILVSSLILVGILGNPEGVVGRNLRPIFLFGEIAVGIQETPHASKRIDAIKEFLGTVRADSAAVLIIEHGNTLAEIVFTVLVEVIRLLDRIIHIHEMVEAPELTRLDSLLHKRVTKRIDVIGALGSFDDDKIVFD